MRTLVSSALLILTFSACSSAKRLQAPDTSSSSLGHTRSKEVAFIDESTYRLTDTTTDATYGYEMSNPIKVGGASERSGPANERRFLNGLAGPNGEAIQYHRTGSCCGFRTPNGINNIGMLDRYKVYWEGCKDTATLFINMYDKGDLKVPVGFSAKE
jgi:hypothetical protein